MKNKVVLRVYLGSKFLGEFSTNFIIKKEKQSLSPTGYEWVIRYKTPIGDLRNYTRSYTYSSSRKRYMDISAEPYIAVFPPTQISNSWMPFLNKHEN